MGVDIEQSGRGSSTRINRTRKIDVRFTEAEYQQILELERTLGVNKTDLVRSRVLDELPKVAGNAKVMMAQMEEITLEIRRCGNNINQIARHVNAMNLKGAIPAYIFEHFSGLFERYLDVLKRWESLMRQLIRSLGR